MFKEQPMLFACSWPVTRPARISNTCGATLAIKIDAFNIANRLRKAASLLVLVEKARTSMLRVEIRGRKTRRTDRRKILVVGSLSTSMAAERAGFLCSTAKENLQDFYDLGEQLGEGAFSKVFLATERATGEQWAVKKITKKFVKRQLLEREIEIMTKGDQKTRHPCILFCKEVFETADAVYLVLELVRGGELYDAIVDFGEYTEDEAKVIVVQLVKAIQYLHTKLGVAHRDLKPENLLLVNEIGEEDDREFRCEQIKLGDFGLSKMFEGEDLQSQCGSPTYVAPEVLLCKPYNSQVDMWAVGVITFVLLSGCFPFFEEGNNFAALYKKIITCEYIFPAEPELSTEAKSFIRNLLVRDPAKRMTPDACLEHPWLKSFKLPSSIGRPIRKWEKAQKRSGEKKSQKGGSKQ